MRRLDDYLNAGTGWELVSANDINDAGQVVGCGFLNGEMHAFLMSPEFPGGVPESASWAMMLAGFGLVGGAMRRARRGEPAAPADA